MKLSATMLAVLGRLEVGDGRIVPLKGGYWLPGDVADEMPLDESEWFARSNREFNGHHVGTGTINALARRGFLVSGDVGYDERPARHALRVHHLTGKVP